MHWFWSFENPDLEYSFWSPRGIPRRRNKSQAIQCNEKETILGGIRRQMMKHGVGIYLVMEHDEHQSEYVADHDRRIRFVSNFTGSSAFVSIGLDWAELATDSRYYLIAERQLGPDWQIRKLGLPNVDSWQAAVVKKAAELNINVGVDPKFISAEVAHQLEDDLAKSGQKLVPIEQNLVDSVWPSQPDLPSIMITEYPLSLAGESAANKLLRLRHHMSDLGAKSMVVYSLEEIAWLLNLRGGDIPYVPVFKAFVVVTQSEVALYTDVSKLCYRFNQDIRVTIHPYQKFFSHASYVAAKPVWVPNGGTWGIERSVNGPLLRQFSQINLMRAVKNETEISGIYTAQLRCSLSIVQYLAWLGEHIDDGLNEYEGGEQLLKIRQRLADFQGNSFETISASGPNASMPHYAPSSSGSAQIRRDQVYLLDSGSQFLQGSTDITRTVHYGEPRSEEIKAYTLVLKGQLAVALAVFPEGTSGFKLDLLARQYLWEEGMDYGHGTGHGIGSYLNIHELPLGIGMTSGPESILVPGHFVSDEPGYYKDNQFGIRLESDILVVPQFTNHEGRKFFSFDITTLVPYEPKLIDVNRLSEKERNFINSYHKKCYRALRPLLQESYEIAWIERCTKPI